MIIYIYLYNFCERIFFLSRYLIMLLVFKLFCKYDQHYLFYPIFIQISIKKSFYK